MSETKKVKKEKIVGEESGSEYIEGLSLARGTDIIYSKKNRNRLYCPKCRTVLVPSEHKNHPDAFQCKACGRVWEKDDPKLS